MKRPRAGDAGPLENPGLVCLESFPESIGCARERQIDLSAEMDRASDTLPIHLLSEFGLDLEAALEHGGLGLARIEPFRDGTYQPTDDCGLTALVLPCFDGPPEPETLCDLIAWEARRPGRWWHRTGWGLLLGKPALVRARARGEPLRLHPTPHAYIAANWAGCCVLQWAHAPPLFEGVRQLRCKSEAWAGFVEKQLERHAPRLPRVRRDRESET